MGSVLEAMQSAAPWALSSLLFGLSDTLDDEGRPVGERRATSAVKAGVEIELRSCPYGDERRNRPMNVSALAQITRHLPAVRLEVATFHGALPKELGGYDAMLACVVDQLAAPMRDHLRARDPHHRASARSAVGHKLAAGYFGALVQLLENDAIVGEASSADALTFLAHVKRTKALIGASEVCAGPPHMIESLTEVFLRGDRDLAAGADRPAEERVQMALLLSDQIRLGIAWSLYDRRAEQIFLHRHCASGRLRPRNAFIEKKMDLAIAELGAGDPLPPEAIVRALPRHFDPESGFRWASPSLGHPASRELALAALALLERADGALLPSEGAELSTMAEEIADYLTAHRETVAAQAELERRLRLLVERDVEVPLALNSILLPRAKALDLFHALIGPRVRRDAEGSLRALAGTAREPVALREGRTSTSWSASSSRPGHR